MIWAGTAAVAYFTGGAMLEKLGPQSLFYVPVAIQVVQLGLTLWLESQARRRAARSARRHRRPSCRAGSASASRRQDQGVSAPGVAGQSLRLYRHQYPHRRDARRRQAAGALDHGGRLLLLALVLRAAGGLLRAVALERLALPLPLAAGRLPRAGRHLCRHSDGAQPGGAGRGANRLRRASSA